MQLSIKRLRWILLAAALLLVAVLAAYIGYGRFKAMRVYIDRIKKYGPTISHDSNGVTFTQSLKDKTVITMHAGKTTQIGEGQYVLHDVAMSVNSVKDNRTDHIYGNEFTYDQNEGIVRAIGEVHMDLQAPQALTSAGRPTGSGGNLAPPPKPGSDPKAEPAVVIHVRTSGLVYLRKLGLATTTQPVEFRYAGIECTAIGAEFDTGASTLRLLSNVVADGVMHGKPVHITALRAEIDRTSNIATLSHPVAVSQDRKAVSDLTVLRLRNDGSIESSRSTGDVTLTGPTQQVTAAELDTTLSPQTVPQTAKLSGGVTLADTNPQRPLHGSASNVDIVFDAHGSPQRITGSGGPSGVAALSMLDKRVLAKGLQRDLQGATIVATLVPASARSSTQERTRLSEVHAIGAAQGHSEALYTPSKPPVRPAEPPTKTTGIAADDLRVTFVADAENHPQPQHLFATGHTLLRQDAPLGEQQTSSGDMLEGTFASSEVKGREQLTLASAVQTGHVVVHRVAALKPATKSSPAATQEVATATADRATYDGAAQKITLSGSAHLTQDNASLTAASVVLDQRTQDADAFGNVQATLESAQTAPAASSPAPPRAPEFTHVLSSSAHFTHETRQAEFHGSDAQPARMWQNASQVQAAVMLLDDVRRTFSAHAAAPGVLIHAVLTGSSSAPAKGAASVVRVASIKMDYSDTLRQAVFTSGVQAGDRVQIDGSSGTIHAQRAVAYLLPATGPPAKSTSPTPFNGSLDRVVVTGDVQIDQPGRHGTGEQLVYTAATGNSVLTGTPANPPHVVDAQQGSITGTTLLFGDSGSTIVVSGQKPAPNQTKPGRVHTETHLQPGTAERH
jgi:lipopolysaccharide export system protein LptA